MAAVENNMAPLSFRRRNLLLDFASLKFNRPDGVYATVSPDDPTLWSGVMFINEGPYSPAVLRFQISFPHLYPDLPPLVTFSTDIFHPLLTPLTTYTYTTRTSGGDPVSATDEERLPPGGFSLRHGFPQWFARTGDSQASGSRNVSGSLSVDAAAHDVEPQPEGAPVKGSVESQESAGGVDHGNAADERVENITPADILRYIRSTFSDEEVLDSLPLSTAANPGACHAWRTYRANRARSVRSASPGMGTVEGGSAANATRGRRPGEWNWDGVWEERVRKGKEASLSEAALYGGVPGGDDDAIRFLDTEAANVNVEAIQRDLGLGDTKAQADAAASSLASSEKPAGLGLEASALDSG